MASCLYFLTGVLFELPAGWVLYLLFLSDLSVVSASVLSPPPPSLLDLRSSFNDREEGEAGSPELSAARAKNSSGACVKGNLSILSVSEADAGAPLHICYCHPVKIDALVNYPEEKQTSSGAEMSVTGSADAVSMKTRTQKFWRCRQGAVLNFLCRAWKRIPWPQRREAAAWSSITATSASPGSKGGRAPWWMKVGDTACWQEGRKKLHQAHEQIRFLFACLVLIVSDIIWIKLIWIKFRTGIYFSIVRRACSFVSLRFMSQLCAAQSNSASLLMTEIIRIVIYIHFLPTVSLKQLTLFIWSASCLHLSIFHMYLSFSESE